MLTIYESKFIHKRIDKLPHHILERYEFWKSIAITSGLEGIYNFKGFRDHKLKGKWNGYRSSYLNESYRIIYQHVQNELKVIIIDINKHDYRR